MKFTLLFSPVAVAWAAVMWVSSVVLVEPTEHDVTQWAGAACSGSALGEMALKHWAAEGHPLSRRAYVDVLAARNDPASRAQRARLLRDAAVTGDAIAATRLAGLSMRSLLNGEVRASSVQITRWFQQGARGGVASAARMLAAMTSSGAIESNDLSSVIPWLQRRTLTGDAEAAQLLDELIEHGGASSPPCHTTRPLFEEPT